MGYKKPKIKAGWEMPHGNTYFSSKDGAKAAQKVYEKNAVKFGQIAEELGTDVEKLKRVFEAEFNRRQKKSAGQNPFDTIRDILQTRAFTTKEEMAYANLREIMTHGGTWRKFLDKAGIVWQTGELGKIDAGGGGTVAMYVANLGIDVIDLGVPVLSMHAPYEVVSKTDVYMTHKAIEAFFKA